MTAVATVAVLTVWAVGAIAITAYERRRYSAGQR